MKNIRAITLALAMLPAVSTAAPTTAAAEAATEVSRIYVVNGNVFVTQGNNPAHRVDGSENLVSRSLVSTGDNSAALLKFEDGQVVTMQANSTFNVREYHYDRNKIENSSIIFSVFRGGMRFITGLIGQHDKRAFRLSTPNATIGIRGTEFMVAMSGKTMYSQVLKGSIGMTNAAGSAIVAAGQSAQVPSASALATLLPATAIPAGTFGELLSIPLQPAAIPAPAPAPAPTPAPAPAPEPLPVAAPAATVEPAAAPVEDVLSGSTAAGAATAGAVAGTAAAGSATAAGAALALIPGSGSDETPAETTPVAPAAAPQPPTEVAAVTDKKSPDTNSRSDLGVTAKLGTLGFGAELNLGLTDHFGTRIGLNTFTYKYNGNSSSVNYDFKLQLQSASVIADWYPFAGSFRTSAGVLYNNNQATLNALPTGGSYSINGTTYLASDVGSIHGSMTFNKVAPYLGIGWGNPVAKNKGWGLTSDLGVLFQGQPKTSLVATCSASFPALQCASLQSDTAAENAKLESDLKNFKWWPVVSIGISYQW